jgi:hypothetical protein
MSVNNLTKTQGSIDVVDSTPTFPKVISIVSSGAGTSGVKGVKGSAEAEYRKGLVSISPENLGFSAVNLENDSGTLSEAEKNLLLSNEYNFITYAPNGVKSYIFKLSAKDTNSWSYSATKEDLTGNMFITVNITTGVYAYSYLESSVLDDLTTHINDQSVHFREDEKEEVEEAVEQVAGQVNQVEESVSQLEETVNSLTMNGGEIE